MPPNRINEITIMLSVAGIARPKDDDKVPINIAAMKVNGAERR